MIRSVSQQLALFLFCIYLAVFPGSTIVVALDRVPDWGQWMGGALLLLQGAAALCWLLGRHGVRGGIAAMFVFLMAWGIEHVGVTSGMPFGRYHYTGALQPQLLGLVPLAIPCAWLMVAAGAWQIATDDRRPTTDDRRPTTDDRLLSTVVGRRWSVVATATLVLLLDLQIETVATRINRYWIWLDGGLYYGVPTANFVAWWLVGLAMALVMTTVLGRQGDKETRRQGDKETGSDAVRLASHVTRHTSHVTRLVSHISQRLPAYLYLFSTLMFSIVNLARGYIIAGLVGALVLLGVFFRQRCILTRRRGDGEIEKWGEA